MAFVARMKMIMKYDTKNKREDEENKRLPGQNALIIFVLSHFLVLFTKPARIKEGWWVEEDGESQINYKRIWKREDRKK